MSKQTVIPQTTVRYYQNGQYRETRFSIKEELEAFERRATKAGVDIYEITTD